MSRRGWLIGAFSATVAVFACSSGSSGDGTNPDGGTGGSSGGNGEPWISCTTGTGPSQNCSLEQVPGDAVSPANTSCTKANGTPGTACPTSGLVGCCMFVSAGSANCSYDPTQLSTYMMSCAQAGGTWSSSDGGTSDGGAGSDVGAMGAAAFVGTWTRAGTATLTCPTGNPTTSSLTGNLVIALGSPTTTILGTAPDGCVTNYSVSGNVATAMVGEAYNETTEAGVAETITVVSHTLTLSADGETLTSTGSSIIDKTATMTMCTQTSSGTFAKQ
jgi:hypothetical protein